MTLEVGQYCTVVYADGGVKVALPVEVATNGQRAFLADFGLQHVGLPLRHRTIDEVAATVPEDPDYPRLQRVVGTIVRDADGIELFVPLGVMPVPEDAGPAGSKVFFVVFADSSPIAVFGGGTQQLPRAFFYRTPGEYDYAETVVSGGFGGSFRIIQYATAAIDAVHIGDGWFREYYLAKSITRRLRILDGFSQTEQFTTGDKQLGSTRTYRYTEASVQTRTAHYRMSVWGGVLEVVETPLPPIQGRRTFQAEYTYYPSKIQEFRQSLTQWTNPPKALVYHVPLQGDAVEGTVSDILPTGTTDTEPLEIIRGDYPTATDVVAKLASEAGEDGIREVRFITAMATLDAAARVTALIDEITGALNSAYEEVEVSTTVSVNLDWLGALAATALQIPA